MSSHQNTYHYQSRQPSQRLAQPPPPAPSSSQIAFPGQDQSGQRYLTSNFFPPPPLAPTLSQTAFRDGQRRSGMWPRNLSSYEVQTLERNPDIRDYLRESVKHVKERRYLEHSSYALYSLFTFGHCNDNDRPDLAQRANEAFFRLTAKEKEFWARAKVDVERDFELIWMIHNCEEEERVFRLGSLEDSLQFKSFASLYPDVLDPLSSKICTTRISTHR